MTTIHERNRSLVQTGEFLRELTQNSDMPESVRREAKTLLRHYPNAQNILRAGRLEKLRKEELGLLADKYGPLHPVLAFWLGEEPEYSEE